MGLVTICKYNRTKTPLFVEQAGVNLYSLEELSYFLYYNICLVDSRFFNERLCRWLLEEVGCEKLTEELRKGIASGVDVVKLVAVTVKESGLFTEAELQELVTRMEGLKTLKEQERLKMRADELLKNRNEWAAMEEYRHILKMHQNHSLGTAFYGAVWNNLGVCYVRQFLFSQAVTCFEKAYEYRREEEILKQAELARKLADGEKTTDKKMADERTQPQKKLLQWEREYRVKVSG